VPVWLRTLIFTVIVPGTVAVYLPWGIIVREKGAYTPAGGWWWLGLVPLGLGVAGYCWCAWDFTFAGHGSPLPIDAPRKLVVRGLYRYVRNPMYVSVLGVIVGQAAVCASRNALLYAAAIWLMFHLFALLYEEPTLRSKFGDDYDDYCRRVPRWLSPFGRTGTFLSLNY
jgi:protein-S-isoprenylcysteine O-methyltransferase Ste14